MHGRPAYRRDGGLVNEWLKIMLEEIRRKRAEADERRREHERRERDAYDVDTRSGETPESGRDDR